MDELSNAELRAIATRAVANGDAYSRRLLREQLEAEEFADQYQAGGDKREVHGGAR